MKPVFVTRKQQYGRESMGNGMRSRAYICVSARNTGSIRSEVTPGI